MGASPQTVGEALGAATERLAASGSESARLDAEVLLGDILGVDRSSLMAHPDARIGTGQSETYRGYVERRESGEPVAYIRGMKEFYGVAITVDARVLIPRPETETLVEMAVARIRSDLTGAPRSDDSPPYLIWDVGTGSGAIAVAVATELRRRRYGDAVRYHVSDVSSDAIAVTTVNAVSHGVAASMTFAEGDLLDVEPPAPRPVDLLVANLPYIPSADVQTLPIAARFEPGAALDGGADGLDIIRRLLPLLPEAVAPTGLAILEIGADQADAASAAAAQELPDWTATIAEDLGGDPRVVQLERSHA